MCRTQPTELPSRLRTRHLRDHQDHRIRGPPILRTNRHTRLLRALQGLHHRRLRRLRRRRRRRRITGLLTSLVHTQTQPQHMSPPLHTLRILPIHPHQARRMRRRSLSLQSVPRHRRVPQRPAKSLSQGAKPPHL